MLYLNLTVAIACGQFIVLVLHGLTLLFLHLVQLLFLLDNFGWNLGVTQVNLRASLIKSVDGLIWHKAVGNIAVCQFDTSRQSLVGICHVVMLLVALLDVMQNLQSFLVCCRFNLHLLESALKCTVFLNALAIFVQRCSSDALYSAACQSWLHYVCSIHRAWCSTSTYDGVNLIDKHYDVRITLQLLHQSLQALLKLSAIFCTCHNACHVEGIYTLTKQHRTCVALLNKLCQTLYYCALTHTRFTY